MASISNPAEVLGQPFDETGGLTPTDTVEVKSMYCKSKTVNKKTGNYIFRILTLFSLRVKAKSKFKLFRNL